MAVILYHTAASYSSVAPYWPIHDTLHCVGNILRELLDVFIMPFFMFAAGYFALSSIRNRRLNIFLWDKFKRLGLYWLFIVIVILPFFYYSVGISRESYIDYWIAYLFSKKDIGIGPLNQDQFNQLHFWFVPLLFYFFVVFAIFYKLRLARLVKNTSSENPRFFPLLIIYLLTASTYFAAINVFPDSTWVRIPLIVQFKATHLPLLIIYFGFGVYVNHQGWLAGKPFHLGIWLPLALLSSILFFSSGQKVFNNIDVSNILSPVILVTYSLARSLLLLSYLVSLIAISIRFFQERNPRLHHFAEVSYEVYLVHFFFIVFLQGMFQHWPTVWPPLKIFTIFAVGTGISYLFSKYTIKKFPQTSAAVLFVLCFVLTVSHKIITP